MRTSGSSQVITEFSGCDARASLTITLKAVNASGGRGEPCVSCCRSCVGGAAYPCGVSFPNFQAAQGNGQIESRLAGAPPLRQKCFQMWLTQMEDTDIRCRVQ